MCGKAFLAVAVLALTSAGCASLYDPLRSREASGPLSARCGADNSKSYQQGVQCAELVRQTYVDAMVDDAVTSDRIAMALIPIGAAAIGLGVSGVSGAPIMGLALGGGALFGGGRWLTSIERRQVFGVGAARSPPIRASTPFAPSGA